MVSMDYDDVHFNSVVIDDLEMPPENQSELSKTAMS